MLSFRTSYRELSLNSSLATGHNFITQQKAKCVHHCCVPVFHVQTSTVVTLRQVIISREPSQINPRKLLAELLFCVNELIEKK